MDMPSTLLNIHSALFYVKKILDGGDLKADVRIYDPNKQEIHKQLEATFVWFDISEIKTEGLEKILVEIFIIKKFILNFKKIQVYTAFALKIKVSMKSWPT